MQNADQQAGALPTGIFGSTSPRKRIQSIHDAFPLDGQPGSLARDDSPPPPPVPPKNTPAKRPSRAGVERERKRADSPDLRAILETTPRPRRRSSTAFSASLGARARSRSNSNRSRSGPLSWKFPTIDGLSDVSLTSDLGKDFLKSDGESEPEGDGSESDSSLDLHTPLPHLMFRDGLLSPRSKLLPQAPSAFTPFQYMTEENGEGARLDRSRSVLSVASTAGSVMTKSGLFKDPRDTSRRRLRHRDGHLLRAGMGLTTGLGWSDSEDEDAPSTLTRRLIHKTIDSRPPTSLSISSRPFSVATDAEFPASSHFPQPPPRRVASSGALLRSSSVSASRTSRPSTVEHEPMPTRGRAQSIASGGSNSNLMTPEDSLTSRSPTPSPLSPPTPLQHGLVRPATTKSREVKVPLERARAASSAASTSSTSSPRPSMSSMSSMSNLRGPLRRSGGSSELQPRAQINTSASTSVVDTVAALPTARHPMRSKMSVEALMRDRSRTQSTASSASVYSSTSVCSATSVYSSTSTSESSTFSANNTTTTATTTTATTTPNVIPRPLRLPQSTNLQGRLGAGRPTASMPSSPNLSTPRSTIPSLGPGVRPQGLRSVSMHPLKAQGGLTPPHIGVPQPSPSPVRLSASTSSKPTVSPTTPIRMAPPSHHSPGVRPPSPRNRTLVTGPRPKPRTGTGMVYRSSSYNGLQVPGLQMRPTPRIYTGPEHSNMF